MGEIHNRKELRELRQALRTHATASEAMLWSCLKNSQLDGRKFRRQHSVGPFVLDFSRPAERLCIEIDGGVHENPTTSLNDQSRDEYLAGMRIRVLRFTNKQVLDGLEGVLDEIRAAFRKV